MTLGDTSDKTPRWQGAWPKVCDICHRDLEGLPFVDGKTVMGPWGILCLSCHSTHGVGLGTGLGQQYDVFGKKVAG